MLLFEWFILASVIIYVVWNTVHRPQGGRFLVWFVLVSIASWITEETCIRLYGLYSYSQDWRIFLSRTPLAIVFVWPAIIHCAWDLSSQLLGHGHRFVPMAVFGIILTDAAFIETVSVQSELWSWQKPGLFNVPLIGIFGWAPFAFLCAFLFEKGSKRSDDWRDHALILILPMVGTHLSLLVSWWGFFRWVLIPVHGGVAAVVAWGLSIGLVVVFVRCRLGTRVRIQTLLLRMLAAICFFILLLRHAGGSIALVSFCAAFAPPYLILMAQWFPARHEKESTDHDGFKKVRGGSKDRLHG